MKNLILTLAIGNGYQRMAKITHQSIKEYAKKINADFKCINKR